MMHYVRNQNGIALVTALMFTMMSLTIIMGLFYLLTIGAQTSGSQKRYKTALEASYGGADVLMKEVVPQIFQGMSSSQVKASFASINMDTIASNACLKQKLTKPSSQWDAACSQSLDPKSSPDISFKLQPTTPNAPAFKVYSKIVDTVQGNSDIGGLQLEGSGVAESSAVITPQHMPYIYRIEVQGERETNATEQANISVLYAY